MPFEEIVNAAHDAMKGPEYPAVEKPRHFRTDQGERTRLAASVALPRTPPNSAP